MNPSKVHDSLINTRQQLLEEIEAIKLDHQELRNQLAKKDDIKKELG
jgi:hypothetical protein